ncbi:MAG: LysM peptidoglycan-binding domain-containing protein [Dehalococcoidia bacterium]
MTLPKLGLVLLLLPAALLAFACGGGSAQPAARTDPAKIPTATLPAQLPEPLIVEGTPAPPVSSKDTYVVASGDSLSSIANKLGTTVEELMSLNGLDSTDLAVGEALKIPQAGAPTATPTEGAEVTSTPTPEGPTETPPPTSETATPSASGQHYTVQSGDNANDIALRFGITVEELAAANHTTVDALRSLQVGDVLIIPPATATTTPGPTTPPTVEATATPEG